MELLLDSVGFFLQKIIKYPFNRLESINLPVLAALALIGLMVPDDIIVLAAAVKRLKRSRMILD
ncbi:hypothetical protein ACFL1R_08840 [Candidatus Latescibacterota bacterium]